MTLADFPGLLPIKGILVYEWQRQHTSPPHIQRAVGAQTKLVQCMVITASMVNCCTTVEPSLNPVQASFEHLLDSIIYHWTFELLKFNQPKMTFYIEVKGKF